VRFGAGEPETHNFRLSFFILDSAAAATGLARTRALAIRARLGSSLSALQPSSVAPTTIASTSAILAFTLAHHCAQPVVSLVCSARAQRAGVNE
jgi:hypothetical protein